MTLSDRQASIDYILEKGLLTRDTALDKARMLIRRLGPRLLFGDGPLVIVFSLLAIGATALTAACAPDQWRHSVAVGCSPITFLVIAAVSEAVDRASRVYEVRQTCYFTVAQVTAVRVMCLGSAGVLVTALVAGLAATDAGDFWHLLLLAVAALSICAVGQLMIVARRHRLTLSIGLIVAWLGLGSGLPLVVGSTWEHFLASLSWVVAVAVCVVCVALVVWRAIRTLTESRYHAFAH
ncbi:MAG: hypothetical protein LBV06_02525 [Propionibacteriaceae bacterium]|jgi:hypothetical protein|nr:hypothetical protein [Propionibacteriaceae bacterium]